MAAPTVAISQISATGQIGRAIASMVVRSVRAGCNERRVVTLILQYQPVGREAGAWQARRNKPGFGRNQGGCRKR